MTLQGAREALKRLRNTPNIEVGISFELGENLDAKKLRLKSRGLVMLIRKDFRNKICLRRIVRLGKSYAQVKLIIDSYS